MVRNLWIPQDVSMIMALTLKGRTLQASFAKYFNIQGCLSVPTGLLIGCTNHPGPGYPV